MIVRFKSYINKQLAKVSQEFIGLPSEKTKYTVKKVKTYLWPNDNNAPSEL